jgi:hypothetical protein
VLQDPAGKELLDHLGGDWAPVPVPRREPLLRSYLDPQVVVDLTLVRACVFFLDFFRSIANPP